MTRTQAFFLSLALAVTPATFASTPDVSVGPQYDTTHVYVSAADMDAFVRSFTATFEGQPTTPVAVTVTPTPSKTLSQVVRTPSGAISVFGFQTPVPYPFGLERTGYLVTNVDDAVKAANAAGAATLVAPFDDPIGRDAVISFPGGVNTQLYWHTARSTSAPLEHVPENRIYLPVQSADAFVKAFVAFVHGKVVSDDRKASAVEIGRSGGTYRRIRIVSGFGKATVLVTDGHLDWPYGTELTGYEVGDLNATLRRARDSGAIVVVEAHTEGDRHAAMVRFPGGYVAEIHDAAN